MQAADFPPDFSLSALRALLDTRELSSVELAQVCIERSQQQAALNVWVDFQPERLLQAAKKADELRADVRLTAGGHLPLRFALLGIPVALKDNIAAAGWGCTAGTRALAGYTPQTDAAVVARIKAAGALIAGKVGMHELALGISNNNAVTGAVRNPWNPDCIPGGSSGGSGAAVAARLVPASIGTDTGGSVRIPAALCGVTGFRPTVGRWPGEGIFPISHTRDTAGPLARSVADCALLDAVVTGESPTLTGLDCRDLRLGVPRLPCWQELDSGLQALAEQALARLADAGAQLVELELPDLAQLTAQAGFPIALYEFEHDMAACLKGQKQAQNTGISLQTLIEQVGSPDVQAVLADLKAGRGVSEEDYRQALHARARLQQHYAQVFERTHVEALVFPTTPRTAARIGEDATVLLNGRQLPTFAAFIRNTDPGSVAALPGVSLPIGFVRGLPVGLALDGPAQSDRRLLAIAQAVERVMDETR